MIAQVGIALTGVVAVALTQFGSPLGKRVACVFGLAGQPFWLYAAASSQQWGMLVVCLLYTAVWGAAVRRNWPAPARPLFRCNHCARRDVPEEETVFGAYLRFHIHCAQPVLKADGTLATTENVP